MTKGVKIWDCGPRGVGKSSLLYLENVLSEQEIQQARSEEQMAIHGGPDGDTAKLETSKGYYRSPIARCCNNTVRVSRRDNHSPLLAKIDEWMLDLFPRPPFRNEKLLQLVLPMVQYTRYMPEVWPVLPKLNHLHHDRTWFPDRIATVLIYIKAPKRGGHTVFPSLMPVPDVAQGAIRQAWFPRRGQQHGARLVFREGAAYNVAEAQCQGAAAADERGAQYENMTLFPVPGDAIVFWHWAEDDQGLAVPAWENYHGACGVLAGEKFALQGFPTLDGLTARYHQRRTGRPGTCHYFPKPHYSLHCE